MTMLVNEYVDTIAREQRREQRMEAAAARNAERAANAENGTQNTSSGSNGLVATALILLNVLLIAGVGVSYAVTPILGWAMLIAFVLVNLYTAKQLRSMFGTDSTQNIVE